MKKQSAAVSIDVSGIPAGLSKKEFYKNYTEKKLKSNINAGAIILYISAGLSLIIGLVGNVVDTVALDIALCIILGLGIQLAKSRVCAVLATLYGLASMIISLVQNGQLTSWLLVIGGVASIIGTINFAKLWKAYEKRPEEVAPANSPVSGYIEQAVIAEESEPAQPPVEE